MNYEHVNALKEYLKVFLIQNFWEDKHTIIQGRALFTAICLTGNIDADTKECDDLLLWLYYEAAIDDVESYEEFVSCMVQDIV